MRQIYEYAKMAYRNIMGSKMRSFLTMLGIIIGIGAVIMVLCIGGGGQRMMDSELGMLGSIQKNHILVDLQKTFYSAATFNPTYPNHKDPASGSWDGITTASQITNP